MLIFIDPRYVTIRYLLLIFGTIQSKDFPLLMEKVQSETKSFS